jgi:hypothetical protein
LLPILATVPEAEVREKPNLVAMSYARQPALITD